MKTLLKYLAPYKWKALLALMLAATYQIFMLIEPIITGKIVDQLIERHEVMKRSDYISLLVFWLGVGIGVAMVSRIAKNLQDYITSMIVQKTSASMYADGLKHVLEMPFRDFEDRRSGETLGILQKVKTDTEKFITSFMNTAFIAIVGLVFVTFYSFSISLKVTLIYLVALPLIAAVSWMISFQIKRVQRLIINNVKHLAGSATESLRNIELVKGLGLSSQEITRLNNTNKEILKLELRKVRYLRSMSFIQGTTVNLVRSFMVMIMLIMIFDKEITAGKYFTFLLFSFTLFNPLTELANVIVCWREVQVSLADFQAILNTPPEPKQDKHVTVGELEQLEFQKVCFSHKSGHYAALDNVSFRVKSGETIAFVGPSGAGKTTMVKLLIGLYQPGSGTILYNHAKGSEIHFDEFRKKIGMVSQDIQLFSGTVRDNLLFAAPGASDEACLEALDKAACHTILDRYAHPLDNKIGEGGMKLSGGEKQRLSIARALLRRPEILIFDEATSSLDSITEREITKTIREISDARKHITILIAHRLSTVMHADKIFVLEKGMIVESGPHEELIAKKGLYHSMWRQQIGERTIDDESINVKKTARL
ncbi:ABC transporter ATP-binding protein [Chitinophaga sp. Hz27]|uniref:ABC transporter ATP-binding protein n=1 Tax=Chitinophaga sp. Hz27 TaxID=3347169 RepID=UPI0035E01030